MPRAVVLLQPGCADWEWGHVLACLREYLGFEVVTASPDRHNVTSIGGMMIDPDTSYDTVDLAAADLVILIGSSAWRTFHDPHLFNRLKARVEAGRPTAAICAGTVAAARAGLLDRRAHTSNSLAFLDQEAGEAYGGRQSYRDVPHAVRDGALITAPGSAPTSFAVACMQAVGADPAMVEGFWEMCRGEFSGLVGGLGGIQA